MPEAGFSEDDQNYFQVQRDQERQADPIIARDYSTLAGTAGTWVAFRDGQLLGTAVDADALASRLTQLGYRWQEVFVRYLPAKDAVLAY